jgi:hypothetical protein
VFELHAGNEMFSVLNSKAASKTWRNKNKKMPS